MNCVLANDAREGMFGRGVLGAHQALCMGITLPMKKTVAETLTVQH